MKIFIPFSYSFSESSPILKSSCKIAEASLYAFLLPAKYSPTRTSNLSTRVSGFDDKNT